MFNISRPHTHILVLEKLVLDFTLQTQRVAFSQGRSGSHRTTGAYRMDPPRDKGCYTPGTTHTAGAEPVGLFAPATAQINLPHCTNTALNLCVRLVVLVYGGCVCVCVCVLIQT